MTYETSYNPFSTTTQRRKGPQSLSTLLGRSIVF